MASDKYSSGKDQSNRQVPKMSEVQELLKQGVLAHPHEFESLADVEREVAEKQLELEPKLVWQVKMQVFLQEHKDYTEEQMLDYLRRLAGHIGHAPTSKECIGFALIKGRLGTWPRILERAGLKEAKDRKAIRLQNRLRQERKLAEKKANRHSPSKPKKIKHKEEL
jgi:hypothetical protein